MEEEKTMRMCLTLTAIAMSGLGLIGITSGVASASGAVTQTQHFPTASQTSPSVNPCTGATGMQTITNKGVAHTTIVNGIVHFTNTFEGTFAFVPDDATQATYTGHATFWDGGSFNVSAGVGVDRFTSNVNVTGTDGSHIQFHENAYATLDANGNPISIKFDKVVLTCG
jgi:hypothetical protein